MADTVMGVGNMKHATDCASNKQICQFWSKEAQVENNMEVGNENEHNICESCTYLILMLGEHNIIHMTQ